MLLRSVNYLCKGIALSLFCIISSPANSQPSSCSYQSYKWNVKLKQAVEVNQVQHSYSSLKQYEVDAETGCTVCQEDQIQINLPGVKTFSVCHFIANELEHKLLTLIENGEVIYEVTGYRVGMTRGDVDKDFNRTQFSNHSFGIALDINPKQNGLYDQCLVFSESCRLLRGGPWRAGYIGSLTRESLIVRELSRLGFRWGGLIQGKQKDFMHFSPSGY